MTSLSMLDIAPVKDSARDYRPSSARLSSQSSVPLPDLTRRVVTLDIYRGFVMLALASEGYVSDMATMHFPGNEIALFLASQFQHVAWQGCHFWDLIQPSFLFLVGASIPYSF